MMNAITSAVEKLEECLPGLTGDHMREVVCRDGVAFWSPQLTYMGIPLDVDEQAQLEGVPPDAPHESSLFVLYIGGDARELLPHIPIFRKLGYTHFIWSRMMKPGTKRWRRANIEHFSHVLAHAGRLNTRHP